MIALPSGTIAFLFTDVEGSTGLWDREPVRMRAALARTESALESAVASHSGALFKKTGDGVCAAFSEAARAVAAALQAQVEILSLTSEFLPIRMAVYTGPAQESGGDYVGPTLNRTDRLLEVAHGRQIILSQATRDLTLGSLPEGASLLDLGDHRLRDLERPEHVYQLVHPDLPFEFRPLNSLSAFRHNLPIHLTSLIGREEEARTVASLLEDHRLVTLYGSGGCGKTRLALQVGADVLDLFPDGVWLIELSNAADHIQAKHAFIAAMGLREEGGMDMTRVIIEHLRDKRALLILDNCEHLVEASARQGQELLRACPFLKVLVTSREVMGLTGEVTYRVPSLGLPAAVSTVTEVQRKEIASAESVWLFLERAGDSVPGYELTVANAAAIADIARRLDGIPLAIELAAARVRTLTVEQIAERLRHHFSVLGKMRGGASRHETIEATMDWSFQLLDDRERALLTRLTTFAGSWTLDAAEYVCASGLKRRASPEPFERDDVMDLLSRLEDKSLVIMERLGASTRYRMLHMVREYAAERLSEQDRASIESRHLDYFLGIAAEAEANLSGSRQEEWLKTLDVEHDNLRVALEIAKTNPGLAESGLLLAGSLARYWHIRGFLSEGRRQLSAVIGLAKTATASKGEGLAHNGMGILAWAQGDFAAAKDHYQKALPIWDRLGDTYRKIGTLGNLGLALTETEDFEEARASFMEGLRLSETSGDVSGAANALNNLGLLASRMEDTRADREFNEASLKLRREMGDAGGIAMSTNNLASIAIHEKRYADARRLLTESLEAFERLGDRSRRAIVLRNIGELHLLEGDREEAKRYFEVSLAEFLEMGDRKNPEMLREKLRQLKADP